MVSSFLDKTGLAYLWGKITALVGGKQDALTFDSTPTANSTNPVTSAGIKAYIDENAGGDAPVENGTGVGSVQSKAYVIDSTTYTQNASGDGATAIGENTIAKGEASSARGINTLASGKGSSAEGYGNVVTINVTCDAGSANASYTETSTAFPSGVSTAYILDPSDSTLYYVASINSNAHTFRMVPAPESAMSNKTMVVMVHCASGQASHTEGCQTWAAGNYSHAEGYDTKADSDAVHAEGYQTKASGVHSHVEGRGCTASSEVQHVQGKYNIVDSSGTYAHIVGNGTGNGTGRSNAHTLDWSGNAWYAGKVSAGTIANPAPVTNANDLATKAYVDANAGGSSPIVAGENTGSAKMDTWTSGNITYHNIASGTGSMAIGKRTSAIGDSSSAKGTYTLAIGQYSSAEGYGNATQITVTCAAGSANATFTESSDVFPYGVTSAWLMDTDLGILYYISSINRTQKKFTINPAPTAALTGKTMTLMLYGAFGEGSHSEGYQTKADALYTHSEGKQTRATAEASHAEGYKTYAGGEYSHAEGSGCSVGSVAAHAEGYGTSASGNYSHAEGYNTEAHEKSHAEGVSTHAYGVGSHAEGKNGFAYGNYSHIEGSDTDTGEDASNAHAEGEATYAYGPNSHVEGFYTYTFGNEAHAEGFYSEAHGLGSHAEGTNGYAFGEGSHAEGQMVYAIGDQAHAEGNGDEESVEVLSVISSGNYEIYSDVDCFVGEAVVYYYNDPETGVAYRHIARITNIQSYGSNKQITLAPFFPDSDPISDEDVASYGFSFPLHYAGGLSSHAEGSYTIAAGEASHAEGGYTIALQPYQHVEGLYNVADTTGNYVHITGIGYLDNNTGDYVRKNGFTVDVSGNGAFAGSLTIADQTGSVTLTAAQLRSLLALI